MLRSQYATVHSKNCVSAQAREEEKSHFSCAWIRPQPPQPLNLLRATHPHRGTHEGWVVGKLRGGGRGLGKWEPPREFPCQRAHLTASLMEPGDVPQGPDGIQWSARWQLVKGGQASWIMETQQSTPPNPTAALMWKCFNLSVNMPLCCRNINRPLQVRARTDNTATLSKSDRFFFPPLTHCHWWVNLCLFMTHPLKIQCVNLFLYLEQCQAGFLNKWQRKMAAN